MMIFFKFVCLNFFFWRYFDLCSGLKYTNKVSFDINYQVSVSFLNHLLGLEMYVLFVVYTNLSVITSSLHNDRTNTLFVP